MKRIASLFALLATSTTMLIAQSGNLEIKGTVFDFESAEPVYPAAVQIFSLPDSTYLSGASTDENGAFTVNGLPAGNMVAKITFVGYIDEEKSFTLKAGNKTTNLGRITIKVDSKVLKDVVVSAALSKVVMVNDTVVFNGDAYKMPEGSSLEDLVRKLPGVQINSDGQITVNGKTVSKILVNGKEFFDNDQSVALQNLTSDMVEKIKAYDKQSDFARQTGIDDGEEQTVLDLTVKKGMAQGYFGNVSVGYGRPLEETIFDVNDLYNVNLSLNRFAEDRQFSIVASASQSAGGAGGMGMMGGGVGGFGGIRGMGSFGGGGGISKNYQAGINFARNIGEEIESDSYKYEIGGSVNVSGGTSENQSMTASENYYTSNPRISQTWGNRTSNSDNDNFRINGQLRFEWNYDKKTSLIYTPSVSYSKSNGNSTNDSKTFLNDPYQWVTNPLDSNSVFVDTKLVFNSPIDEQAYKDSIKTLYRNAIWNSQNNRSKSESEQWSTSGSIQFVRRLGNNGRNISFRGTYSYSDNSSLQSSRNFQTNRTMNMTTGILSPEDTTLLNRYNDTPNKSTNLSGQISYTEPIGANTFLQLSYNISYSNSNSDRIVYDFKNTWAGYAAWGVPDWILEDNYRNYQDSLLSQYATRKNINHTAQLQIRKVSDKYNLNAGISILPQYQSVIQDYQGEHKDLSRTVYNWTPTVNLRYRWTRQEQINFQYRGSSSQPNMEDLIELESGDNSNPLAVTNGNSSLKPTFQNSLSLRYQKYNSVTMASFMGNVSFSNTLRNIQRKTTLMANGGTYTRPENMSGAFSNWNTSASITYEYYFNDQRFSFNVSPSFNFRHQESWASVIGQESQLRTSLTTGANGSLSTSYRDSWVTVDLQGTLRYNHSTNDLQPDRNMDTYDFNYGPSVIATLPWRNARLATDLQMSSRRGYTSKDMNTDELIWNASASVSFLKGNKGTIQLAVYDILQQRSNVSRQMTATMRSDTYNNSINSYFMATFIYRIQMFGDKEHRQNMRGRGGMSGGFGGGMGGFGGGMGGGFGGGFGGGMGGGFGGGF